MLWRCRDRALEVGGRTWVMGVVNVTPDSFSDGGRYVEPAAAIGRGRQGALISADTASAEVAERALAAGAVIVNDVTALGDPAMAGVVARSGAGVVLMHMRGTPADMQRDPRYDDVAAEVAGDLGGRLEAALAAGIAREAVALDPGVGFGKTGQHSLELLARLDALTVLGRPVVVGVSRKSFIGQILDLAVDQRLEGSLAAAAVAVFQGAGIVRAHDVAATVRAVRIADALRMARG